MNLSARIRERSHEVVVERRDAWFVVVVDGDEHLVDAHKLDADFYSILIGGRSYEVSVEPDGGRYFVRHGAAEEIVELTDPSLGGREELLRAGAGPAAVVSVMPGKVVRVLVQPGDTVETGQGLVVVEAMKMENEIAAARPGKVVSVDVEPGQAVEAGARLVVLE